LSGARLCEAVGSDAAQALRVQCTVTPGQVWCNFCLWRPACRIHCQRAHH